MGEDQKTTEQKAELPKGKQIGQVTHYFNKIGVAVVELTQGLKVGDSLVVSGRGQEFEQAVDSMQVEHDQVTKAKKGDAVGLKVDQDVKEGDAVFLKG